MPDAGTQSRFAIPLVIAAANADIRVTCNAVAATVSINVLAAGVAPYYWRDDASAADLVAALIVALESHPQLPTVSAALLEDGKLYLTSTKSMTIHWGNVLTTIDPAWFGFAAGDSAFILTATYKLTSTYQAGRSWWPEVMYHDDSGLYTEHQVEQAVDLDGKTDTWLFGSRDFRDIGIKVLPASKIFAEDAATNEDFAAFRDYLATGGPFEWCPDWATPGTYYRMVIRNVQWLRVWPVKTMAEVATYYRVSLPMQSATGWV
mgnify:CR=1 FL=1